MSHAWILRMDPGFELASSFKPVYDDMEVFGRAHEQINSGVAGPDDAYITRFRGSYGLDRRRYREPPPFFTGGPFPIINAEFAAVLREFDLGATRLLPVELLRKKGDAPALPGDFFLLAIGETKDVLLPDRSDGIGPNQFGGLGVWLETDVEDDMVVLSGAAREGADFWQDMQFGLYCVGDRLGQALIAKGWDAQKYLRMLRCRIEGE